MYFLFVNSPPEPYFLLVSARVRPSSFAISSFISFIGTGTILESPAQLLAQGSRLLKGVRLLVEVLNDLFGDLGLGSEIAMDRTDPALLPKAAEKAGGGTLSGY